MAVPTISITGSVVSPDARAMTSGTIRADLSNSGSALDGVTFVSVSGRSVGTVAAGAVTMELVANDLITPAGTYYYVTFDCVDATGRKARWSEKWQLVSGSATLDIGSVSRIDVVPGVSLAPYYVSGSASVTATGATTARTLPDRATDCVCPEDYGAAGDGVTDDTVAWAAAMASGHNVRGLAESVYLIDGGTVLTTPWAVVDMSGATVKLKNAATNRGLLTLSGTGSRVVGGNWDLNRTNNTAGQDGTSAYGNFAVLLNADKTSVFGARVTNSYGLGIKGAGGCDHIAVRGCWIDDCQYFGIYLEGSGAVDTLGSIIEGNTVDASAHLAGYGIGVYSVSPFTYRMKNWIVRGNTLIGSTNGANTGVGITVRGVDGVVTGNVTTGWDIAISLDLQKAQNSAVVGNRVSGVAGATGYGIEVNGGSVVVSGNVVNGGKYGVIGTTQNGQAGTLNENTITGNLLTSQTVKGVYIAPAADATANRLNIGANTIRMTEAAGVNGIALTRDCAHTLISGNVLDGPGNGQANSRGVFLDSVTSDVAIIGNRFANWERAADAYSASATPQLRLSFMNNDLAEITASAAASAMVVSGSATFGTGCRVYGNTRGTDSTPVDDILAKSSGLLYRASDSFSTPEGNVAAPVGSIYVKTTGTAPLFYVKESGTGNTGWVGK